MEIYIIIVLIFVGIIVTVWASAYIIKHISLKYTDYEEFQLKHLIDSVIRTKLFFRGSDKVLRTHEFEELFSKIEDLEKYINNEKYISTFEDRLKRLENLNK